VFLVFAAWGYYKGWSTLLLQGLAGLCLLFLVLTALAPAALAPLNRAWFAFGLMLGRVVSPVTLGLMFFLLITPVALVARWCGRDELRLKKRQVASYWIDRAPGAVAAESFRHQF
ncbi:MAG: hypothetical protein RLZZ401_1322, partial [Pseudomonadota bacterium]